MTVIAISGYSGSGKTTAGRLLSKKLGFSFVSYSFKELAEEKGMSLMEFQYYAEKHPEVDVELDNRLREDAKKGNSVVATWLAGWILEADFRIFLHAPLETRAERVAKRDSISFNEALEHVKERDSENRKRYLKLYNIDIQDTSNFDLCLSSKTYSPEEIIDIILFSMKKKGVIEG